jgi:cell division protein ZipA
MNPRELVILSLGLAIVAVVLRGLYVALRARRGQLRLAIDKNIPQDIDLDDLELAELPGGGARVVARNLDAVNRQNSAVESANVRAASIALGKKPAVADAVPVLMDPVEIRDTEPTWRAGETVADEDPDNILFDYPDTNPRSNPVSESARSSESESSSRTAIDTMSQVAPDYDDDDYEEYDEDEDEEEFDDYDDESLDDEDDFDDDHSDDDYDEDEDDFDEESEDSDEDFDDEDDYDSDLDEMDDDEDSDYDEDLDFENDDDLDDFSMTAGERIGFSEPSRPIQPAASETIKAADEAKPERTEKQRRPLFAAFGRALKAKDAEPAHEPEIAVAQPQPRPQPRPQVQHQIQPQTQSQTKPQTKPQTIPQTIQSSSRPVPITAQHQRRNRTDEIASPAEPTQVPKNAPEYVATEPSEVVVLNVMARPGRQFAGDDLLHALITSGMKFGDMNIFHRRLAGESKGPVIFSAANILNPGVFDLNRMHEFTTLGISLFLALPTPINNLEAFTQMLDAARKLGDALDGELRDDNRNLMTAQTIEHYRQRIRDFELRRLKAVGTRG